MVVGKQVFLGNSFWQGCFIGFTIQAKMDSPPCSFLFTFALQLFSRQNLCVGGLMLWSCFLIWHKNGLGIQMVLSFWAVGQATKDGIKGCNQCGMRAIVVGKAQGTASL